MGKGNKTTVRRKTIVFNPSTTMKKRTSKSVLKTILWRELPEQSKIFCKRIPPKNPEELLDSCVNYKNKWVNAKYGISQVDQENSPLYIFKETEADKNNLDYITDGIHNFILFWDGENSKYELVTSYFNAIEFGSKHSMIACRTEGLTASKFLLSGEIKKNGTDIVFQNVSSQYFENEQSLLKRAAFIYLNEIIADHPLIEKATEEEQKAEEKNNLDKIKGKFIGTGKVQNFFSTGVKIVEETAPLGKLLEKVDENPTKFLPRPGSVLNEKYIATIKNMMQDAFNKIFPYTGMDTDMDESDSESDTDINVSYVAKFTNEEYKEQKNIDNFLEGMCRLERPVEFDVYEDKAACDNKKNKALYNSCNIPAIGMGGTKRNKRTKKRKSKNKRKGNKRTKARN